MERFVQLDEALALAKLFSDIQGMSDGPVLTSNGYWTPNRSIHVTFVNGVACKEGGITPSALSTPQAAADVTLEAVREYRRSIGEDVYLVWRSKPELQQTDDGYRIRTRLCFEVPTYARIADLEAEIERLQALAPTRKLKCDKCGLELDPDSFRPICQAYREDNIGPFSPLINHDWAAIGPCPHSVKEPCSTSPS